MLDQTREVFSVSQINRIAREILEEALPLIWVEGEISNLSMPSSGHVYFSLKDANAQVRCALFRNRKMSSLQLENGLHVLTRARVSLYEGRGDYQLIIEYIEEAGFGKLQRAFELLKQKLQAEGLFELAHKKVIPVLPQKIGIITSPTGAAIQDILSVLRRRFPAIPIVIYPSQVQGELAAGQIVQALQIANKRKECDVLILSRGGGSLEDLWPFNDEAVARAIYASDIPIISAVGHEIDFTIADFVADQRAATPSAAAELVSPNQIEWQENIARLQTRIILLSQRIIKQQQQQLSHLQRRLRHPSDLLRDNMQRLDYFEQTLVRIMQNTLHKYLGNLKTLSVTLQHYHPAIQLKLATTQLQTLTNRIQQTIKQILLQSRQQLQVSTRALETVSPLATLDRGYAIVTEAKTGKILRSIEDISLGDQIQTRLMYGNLLSNVLKKESMV